MDTLQDNLTTAWVEMNEAQTGILVAVDRMRRASFAYAYAYAAVTNMQSGCLLPETGNPTDTASAVCADATASGDATEQTGNAQAFSASCIASRGR